MKRKLEAEQVAGSASKRYQLDGKPFEIGELTPHESGNGLTVRIAASGQTQGSRLGARFDAFGGKADISQPTPAANPVENDPSEA